MHSPLNVKMLPFYYILEPVQMKGKQLSYFLSCIYLFKVSLIPLYFLLHSFLVVSFFNILFIPILFTANE